MRRLLLAGAALLLATAVWGDGLVLAPGGGGSSPCAAFGTTAGTCAQGNDSRFPASTPLLAANNLSDLANTSTARTNLGLGTAATQNTGTSGATIPLLNGANTWSGVQTITQSDLALLGSSTGKTTLNSGLSGAGNNTLTLPVTASDTLAALGTAETWTAVQTFTNSDFAMLGSSTGNTVITSDNAGASNFTVHLPAANDTIDLIAAAQTLSNKTIVSPTFTGTVAGANTIPLSILSQIATNTILANVTSGTANVAAFSMPSCSATGNALNWTTNTGATCQTGLATLASPTFTGTVGGTNVIPLTVLAQAAGGTMLANTSATTGNITATITPVLGIEGTSTGTLRLNNTTASNSVTLTPGTGGNDAIITFPATSDTVTYNSLAQTLSNKTINSAILTGNNDATNAAGFRFSTGTCVGGPNLIVDKASVNAGAGCNAAGNTSLYSNNAGATAEGLRVSGNGLVSIPQLTTGTNADFVCAASSPFTLQSQTSSCTISSKRFKTLFGAFKGDALYALMHLTLWDFKLNGKNADPNGMEPTVGLTAEGVAQWASACTIWESKRGKFVLSHGRRVAQSYKPECLTGMLVKSQQQIVQRYDAKIASLETEIADLRKRLH